MRPLWGSGANGSKQRTNNHVCMSDTLRLRRRTSPRKWRSSMECSVVCGCERVEHATSRIIQLCKQLYAVYIFIPIEFN